MVELGGGVGVALHGFEVGGELGGGEEGEGEEGCDFKEGGLVHVLSEDYATHKVFLFFVAELGVKGKSVACCFFFRFHNLYGFSCKRLRLFFRNKKKRRQQFSFQNIIKIIFESIFSFKIRLESMVH